MPTTSPITARQSLPQLIERAQQTVLRVELWRDGALVSPSAGQFTAYDEDGTEIVSSASVTITSGVATYAVLASAVPVTLTLSDRWRVKWVLEVGGVGVTVWQDAALVLRALRPVVSDEDLLRRHYELRVWLSQDRSSYQDQRDEAWDAIEGRLLSQGRRPWLIMSPWSLRAVHVALSLAIIFRDASSSASGGMGKYDELAKSYMAEYEAEWDRIVLTYDEDQDDLIDADEQGVSGQPVLMAVQPARWSRITGGSVIY